ncbi:MBL fold metallo-hydrolase [Aliifodinibius sp. S!AR15-10]|uniref:MBL fold metallo-hydrolase n=1 Tax=Aliifodinibius sp. S!AR15-10 TaxID=2950437 RepID=UPI00285D10C6|nr:MBL fold metallo-hydrolase [Aliifodinibius sp. S!AR15-10]MDR8393528.1 MBL fold metallo-hydrolase [Aliifodinibius sp. S!AR15-10]
MSHLKIGPFSLYTIETGRFRLDGGAMFGVVPKTLWNRQIEADNKNRIPMAMRCLLIESEQTGRCYLVDNGIGTKFNEKYEQIYQVDHQHSNLLDSLSYHGFAPEDITDLIFTHLHFDHCGGTTFYDKSGELSHTFPNAQYHVTETHWKTANNPNARETASFFEENIGPIKESGRLNLVGDQHLFEEGLSTLIVNGHTLGQQLPVIKADNRTHVFAADLFPTAAHVPLPWIMGYDMRPINTLEEKEDILNRASSEGWFFFMEHDSQHEVIQIEKDDGKFRPKTGLRLGDLDKRW